MAGTLFYKLYVEHVYQRRFGDSAAFAEALRNSHWYIIARRPSVRIIGESVQIQDNMITADFVTRENPGDPERLYSFGSDFYEMGDLENFQTYQDGAYFSVDVNDTFMHGDAWALASFLSHASPLIARQEVLYIGEAFGNDGKGNAWKRTRQHKKLQHIYEHHVNDDYEVFIAPLSLERAYFSSDDHIDDMEDGPSLSAFYSAFGTLEGRLLKPAVDLVEHALIAYFNPPYNSNLTEWRADTPTVAMGKMRAGGFRLIQVHLSGWWGLARFYSSQEPDGSRSHFISHDLPPNPVKDARRGISAPQISDWRIGARLARDGQQIFADRSEEAAVLLRAFGDEAPEDRKPAGITLRRSIPQEPSARQRVETHDDLRASLAQAREARRWLTDPIPHDGHSSYDSETGTIIVGEYADGEAVRMRLDEPSSGDVFSALIIGNPGMGKTNALRVIALEAAMSGKFLVVPLLPSREKDLGPTDFWSAIAADDRLIATNSDKAIEILTLVRDIANKRLEYGPSQKNKIAPSIVVAVDDSDALLQQDLGARLVKNLLHRGASARVGLLLVVSDINSLKGDIDLMHELVSCETKSAYMPGGHHVIAALTAMYGKRRAETWHDGVATFVLHREGARTNVGFLAGFIPGKVPSEAARAQCEEMLSRAGVHVTEWTHPRKDGECLTMIDPLSVRSYELRRHCDGWTLVAVISEVRGQAISDPAELVSWADEVIRFRFTVQHPSWQQGPSSQCPNALTFYSDIEGDLVVNNVDELLMDTVLQMH
jgi:hypothetical protein